MFYTEYLVTVRAFHIVEVGFLLVCHINKNVDQCFSQTSGSQPYHDAIALQDHHLDLRHTKNGTTNVCNLKGFVN